MSPAIRAAPLGQAARRRMDLGLEHLYGTVQWLWDQHTLSVKLPHRQKWISQAGKKGPYAGWIIRSDVLCSFSALPFQLCWSAEQIETGKALHRYCREENIMFFLVCQLNPGNVKTQELISKNCLSSVKGENNREAYWGGDGRGDDVERIEKPFPCYGYLVHPDTQKETPINGTPSRHLPARNTFIKEKISLNSSGSSLWTIQITFISHIKKQETTRKSASSEQQFGWILHTLIKIAPHPPSFTGLLQHKTISQGHGNNDTEIQSIEIKHKKLTLIKGKLCHLSKGSSLLFKTIQQSLITAIVYCSKGSRKLKNTREIYYATAPDLITWFSPQHLATCSSPPVCTRGPEIKTCCPWSQARKRSLCCTPLWLL